MLGYFSFVLSGSWLSSRHQEENRPRKGYYSWHKSEYAWPRSTTMDLTSSVRSVFFQDTLVHRTMLSMKTAVVVRVSSEIWYSCPEQPLTITCPAPLRYWYRPIRHPDWQHKIEWWLSYLTRSHHVQAIVKLDVLREDNSIDLIRWRGIIRLH
jgi:hypothetical protein